jgi:hypothetical protein
MKSNKLIVSFDLRNKEDMTLYNRVKSLSEGDYEFIKEEFGESSVILPANVLYFESFKKSPNKGVHKLKNLFKLELKTKHKFYTGDIE